MGHHGDHEHTADCGCEQQVAEQATEAVAGERPEEAIERLNEAGDIPGGVRP